MSRIEGRAVFVTGANRGIGRAFVEELLAAGAAKVYAGARDPRTLADLVAHGDGRVVAVELDVTKPEMIETAATACEDVAILINNAGIAAFQGLSSSSDSARARAEMETNYFGSLNMIRSFAPTLAANGGGTIVNMSSIAGLVNIPVFASYSASKAAVHSLTQGARAELAGQGTLVVGVYPGPVDTDMGANLPLDRTSPNVVAKAVLDGIEADKEDIFPDPLSRQLYEGLTANPKAVEKQLGAMLGA